MTRVAFYDDKDNPVIILAAEEISSMDVCCVGLALTEEELKQDGMNPRSTAFIVRTVRGSRLVLKSGWHIKFE